jgi:hypothetical protein
MGKVYRDYIPGKDPGPAPRGDPFNMKVSANASLHTKAYNPERTTAMVAEKNAPRKKPPSNMKHTYPSFFFSSAYLWLVTGALRCRFSDNLKFLMYLQT